MVPFDASASESTLNNQSYILGFKTDKNITLSIKTPDTATLTNVNGEIENILITQTYSKNLLIKIKLTLSIITILSLRSEDTLSDSPLTIK